MSTFQSWYGNHRVRPIEDRTFIGARPRIRSPWTATFASTTSLLSSELRALEARDVVLQIDVTESQIRLDGELKANARPASPAIALSFESKHGPLRYAADLYDAPAWGATMSAVWQHNLRAIAMTLQALRAVDRYGVNASGEQYTGNLAIESAESSVSRNEAIRTVALLAGVAWAPGMQLSSTVIRRAKAETHPDANNGERATWEQLQHALKILGLS